MKKSADSGERTVLSARQALICAAITGWAGDGPSSWQSPKSQKDIVEWAQSYLGSAASEELDEAFQELLAENLFFLVCHPVFAVPVYYCSLDSTVLRELPDEMSFIEFGSRDKRDVSYVADMWDGMRDEYSEENGTTWLRWGLCAAQGSQGPSDSPWGPCLGSDCCCFKRGDEECNWGLSFGDVKRTGWPDMSFLQYVKRDTLSQIEIESQAGKVLKALKTISPDFPWPSD